MPRSHHTTGANNSPLVVNGVSKGVARAKSIAKIRHHAFGPEPSVPRSGAVALTAPDDVAEVIQTVGVIVNAATPNGTQIRDLVKYRGDQERARIGDHAD